MVASFATSSTGSFSPPTTSSYSKRVSRAARKSSTRSSALKAKPIGVELVPPTVRRCANRCEFCFIEGSAAGSAQEPLRARRRLSAFVRLRQFRDAVQREGARHRADPRVPPLAALRLGTCDAMGSAQGLAQQPARSRHRRAADASGCWRDSVSLPDGDRSWAQRRRRSRAVAARISGHLAMPSYRSPSFRLGSRSSRISTRARRWTRRAPPGCSQSPNGGLLERSDERGDTWVFGSDELYLLAERALPDASHYGDFAQIENGVGSVTSLRDRVRAGLTSLPALTGKRIGVVTGVSMAPLMPELLDAAH